MMKKWIKPMKRHAVLFAAVMAAAAVIGQTNTVKVKVVQCWDDSLTTDVPLVALGGRQ